MRYGSRKVSLGYPVRDARALTIVPTTRSCWSKNTSLTLLYTSAYLPECRYFEMHPPIGKISSSGGYHLTSTQKNAVVQKC